MPARKRASANVVSSNPESSSPETTTTHQRKSEESKDSPIAPPKLGLLLKIFFFFLAPYTYLIFYHYNIDKELRKSIIINAGLSIFGFFVTLKMIPIASKSVLRCNLFGYDINRKGTPQGTVKV